MCFRPCYDISRPNWAHPSCHWDVHVVLQFFTWSNRVCYAQMLKVALILFSKTFGAFRPTVFSSTPWWGRRRWRKRPAGCHRWWTRGISRTSMDPMISRIGWILERQYLVQYIIQSEAGFYIQGVRLRFFQVSKMCYYLGAILFAVVSQVMSWTPSRCSADRRKNFWWITAFGKSK